MFSAGEERTVPLGLTRSKQAACESHDSAAAAVRSRAGCRCNHFCICPVFEWFLQPVVGSVVMRHGYKADFHLSA